MKKFETLMLQCLFTASLVACVLTLGAMLTSQMPVANIAGSNAPAAAMTSAAG